MINLFNNLFNISVSASILAAAVIVFRLLFKKAPKWIICLLWGIVGLRLVFPFSVESIIGLLPRSNIITDSGTVNTGIYAVDDVITGMAYSIATVAAPATHSAKTGMGTTAVIGEILFYVWLAGFIVMAVASAVSFIKIRLKVNQSIKLRDNIYICDEIDTPFILGIFRPEIFIPSGLDETKIQSIIAHEIAHIHRRDNWWKPLGFLILSVYWFNPVLWAAYILLCRDIEFACDEKVLKNLTAEEIADYSQTLLDCSKPGRLVTVCPLSFGEVGVKQRIKSALSYKKPAFWIITVALILSAALAVAFTTKTKNIKTDMVQYKVSEVIYQLDDGTSEDENSGIMYCVEGYNKSLYWYCPIYSETSSYGWIKLKNTKKIELSEQSFDDLFLGTNYNRDFALKIKQDNKEALYAQTEGRVFYFLRQNNGYFYMCNILRTEDGKDYIRNIQKLEKTALTFGKADKSVAEKESELKSEVSYKDVIGLWGTEDGEQQIKLDKKSHGSYPATLLYYEDGKLQEDKFTYSLKYDSAANITNLIFSADDYFETYIVSCNSNTMVIEYRDTEIEQTDTIVFRKDFPLKEVVLTDNYNGKEPTTTAIYLSVNLKNPPPAPVIKSMRIDEEDATGRTYYPIQKNGTPFLVYLYNASAVKVHVDSGEMDLNAALEQGKVTTNDVFVYVSKAVGDEENGLVYYKDGGTCAYNNKKDDFTMIKKHALTGNPNEFDEALYFCPLGTTLNDINRDISKFDADNGEYDDWGLKMEFACQDGKTGTLSFRQSLNAGKPEGELSTGAMYVIEANDNGSWISYEDYIRKYYDPSYTGPELSFITTSYFLSLDDIYKMDIDFTQTYGQLKPGKYRIAKAVSGRTYYAEFTVK